MAETDESPPVVASSEPDEDAAGSLVADLRHLAEDAQTAVEAEIAYQRARAGYAGGELQTIALRFAIAAIFASVAVLVLAFGLVLGLSPLVGPWAAAAIVAGALALLALVAALAGRRRLGRMKRIAFPRERELP